MTQLRVVVMKRNCVVLLPSNVSKMYNLVFDYDLAPICCFSFVYISKMHVEYQKWVSEEMKMYDEIFSRIRLMNDISDETFSFNWNSLRIYNDVCHHFHNSL